jgi:hypothetical protein
MDRARCNSNGAFICPTKPEAERLLAAVARFGKMALVHWIGAKLCEVGTGQLFARRLFQARPRMPAGRLLPRAAKVMPFKLLGGPFSDLLAL